MAHDAKHDGRFTILIHTFYATGHVLPMQAVATVLVNRGHRVIWLTHPDQESRVLASGAEFVPTEEVAAVDAVLQGPPPTTMAGLVDFMFGNRLTAQVADLRRALATRAGGNVDCLLHDALPYGAAALYELGEVPLWATLGVVPMYQIGDKASTAVGTILTTADLLLPCLNQQRADLGLGALKPSDLVHYSPYQHIQASCPSLEFGRTRQNLHYVGPLVTAKEQKKQPPSLPDWWADVEAHPCVVGITQGTYNVDPKNLLMPAIEALCDDDNLLLVVPSPYAEKIREELEGRGLDLKNVRMAGWVPYDRLLPRCRVLVTNGGYGSVTQSLSHGVPLICAGTSEDKKDTAERMTSLGAGIDLGTDSPSADVIRSAVQEILGDDRYKISAANVGEELNSSGGAQRACNLLEEAIVANQAER